MKELSIEEKARRYDEAIERAKSKIKNDKDHVLYENDIIEMFPELKESEDERMRKAIIALIEWSKSYVASGITTDKAKDMIAWLEKKGEQKSIDDLTQQEAMDIAVAKCFEQGEQKPAFEMKTPEESLGIDSDTYNKIVDECVYGEQISANETPYPETLEEAIDLYYNSYGNGEGEFEHLSLEKFRDIVHTFVSDYGQKPAWSEEDETTKNNISHIIRQYDKISKRENQPCCYVGDCLLWMQNIKGRVQLQPKQEWSEEEKARIDKIVDVLDWAEEKGYIRYSDWEDYVCYVKSLRPQNTWKPSEEQIIELRRAISGCSYDIEPLVEIEEQLKKLKE